MTFFIPPSRLNQRNVLSFTVLIFLISSNIGSLRKIHKYFLSRPNVFFRSGNERVAVCIAGSARTFHYPGVHENIYTNGVHRLLRNYSTNVFFVINVDEDDAGPMKMAAYRNASGTRLAVSNFMPAQLVEIQNITSFAAFNDRYIPKPHNGKASMFMAPKWCNDSSNPPILFSHTLYRTKQCMDIIENYELQYGINFSWIYKLRPDVVFLDPLSTPDRLREDILYTSPWAARFSAPFSKWWMENNNVSGAGNGGVGDQFLIASRKVAKTAFRAFDITDDCEMYRCPLPNSESQLRMWLVKNNVAYQQLPELWDIVRQNVYDCSWMKYVEHPNLDLMNRTRKCELFRKTHAESLPKPSDINESL